MSLRGAPLHVGVALERLRVATWAEGLRVEVTADDERHRLVVRLA